MIKNDRLYIYGEHEILNTCKQKWKGRFYKKLHGDKCGWSFPIEFRAVIENLLTTIEIDTKSETSKTSVKSDKSKTSVKSDKSKTSSIKSEKSKTSSIKSKTKSEWNVDIPKEIYDFFKKYLE